MLLDCSEGEFRERLPGRTVIEVARLGKFLLLRLDGPEDLHLTIHLGMTGQVLVSQPEVAHPHTRFTFWLNGPGDEVRRLEFRDMRKFGRVHLTSNGPPSRVRTLGPDAWAGAWDAEYLAERMRGRKAPLKAFLLDQRNLAGIGNIYADETLWWAGLAPIRVASSLSPGEIGRLTHEIRARLDEGVRRLGCTLADFVDTQGNPGGFQKVLQAYGRRGEVCARCGGTLVRVVVAGRGTTYCPGCQR